MYTSLTTLVKFIPRNFVFNATINLTFNFSYSSLLLRFLCNDLYPAVSLNSLTMILNSFLVSPLRFSIFNTMSSVNTYSSSWFLIWMPFFFFANWVVCVCVCEVAQLCPTLCDAMDYSLSGSSIHWTFQTRVLESVAISFSRTCNTMLSKSGGGGKPCLTPYLRKKAFNFSQFSMVLAIELSHGLYCIEVHSPWTFLLSFYPLNGCWI